MPYGLRDCDLALIVDAIKAFPEVERVLLAGVLNEEKPLPYYFDVLDYAGITEPRLVEHIERVGIVIYDRASQPGHA